MDVERNKQFQLDIIGSLIESGHGTPSLEKYYCEQLSLPIVEPSMYYDADKQAGFFSILHEPHLGTKKQHSYRLHELPVVLKCIDRTRDTWISQNEFKKPNRRLVNLMRINTCFVDIDCYKVSAFRNEPPEKMCSHILFHCEENDIPYPSVILSSGGGLQCKWILEKPVPAQALPRWDAIQRYLSKYFEPYGADKQARDASRVLRLERTVNRKYDPPVVVRVLYPDDLFNMEKYDFGYFAEWILPYTREQIQEFRERARQKREQGQSRTGKSIVERITTGLKVFSARQLNWDRLHDVRTLAQLRRLKHGGIPDGQRDPLIFLSACFLSWSTEPPNIYQEIVELAREYIPSWSYNIARNKASAAYKRSIQAERGKRIKFNGKMVDPRYRWKNNTIIEWLEIENDEMQHMQTIISKDEKRCRDRERKRKKRYAEKPEMVTRDTYLMNARDRRKQVRKLRRNGYSLQSISELVGVSVDTVKTYLYRRV